MSDLLRQLGHTDAAECVRPVHLIGGFKPADVADRFNEFAALFDHACISCVNKSREPEFIWHPAPNAVNQLVKVKMEDGHILGFIGLNSDGRFVTNTEPASASDEQLSVLLLTCFARGFSENPEYVSANELLNVAGKPESFDPANIEKTLDFVSDLAAQRPVEDIHTQITYGNRTAAKEQ